MLSHAPLIPEAILRRHACFIDSDTRFRAAARLRQSLWREEMGLPPGLHRPGSKRDLPRIRLGSLLQPSDAARGLNFLNPAVHAFVRRTLLLREEGAAINYERLHRNLLSSEPLNYNLLAPLAENLDLATAVFRQLLPSFVDRVNSIRFETAPSRDRSDPRFLTDATAMDAAVIVTTTDGEEATVFIEVKYSEGCTGPAATHRPRYDEVSRAAGLYRDPEAKVLRSVQLEQLWRLSLLSHLCVNNGLTPRAHLLVLYPQLNRRVAVATRLYAAELIDTAGSSGATIGFTALTLEAFVEALHQAGGSTQAAYLNHRYLNLNPVLDLVLGSEDRPSDNPSPLNLPPTLLALPAPSAPSAPAGDAHAAAADVAALSQPKAELPLRRHTRRPSSKAVPKSKAATAQPRSRSHQARTAPAPAHALNRARSSIKAPRGSQEGER